MFRRMITAAMYSVLCSFIMMGCAGSAKTFLSRENLPEFPNAKILKVTLTNGENIQFDRNGAYYYEQYQNRRRVIIGKTENGQSVALALVEVRQAYVESAGRAEENSRMIFPTVLVMGVVIATVFTQHN